MDGSIVLEELGISKYPAKSSDNSTMLSTELYNNLYTGVDKPVDEVNIRKNGIMHNGIIAEKYWMRSVN
jgi:hypothetical protein